MALYDVEITLVEKNHTSVIPVTINDNSSLGNLNEYRLSARYTDTINGKTKNGTIVLRCPDGLFLTNNPILNNENTKNKYLIQVQLFQSIELGQLFRFEISKSTADMGDKAMHVSLELTGYDIRIQEFLDSENHRLQSPKESFGNRIINFTIGRNLSEIGSIKITYNDELNLLPDILKQDWLVSSPITTKSHLDEIIQRISKPEIIGSTNEDWFYNIIPQSDTESFRIFVDKMGGSGFWCNT